MPGITLWTGLSPGWSRSQNRSLVQLQILGPQPAFGFAFWQLDGRVNQLRDHQPRKPMRITDAHLMVTEEIRRKALERFEELARRKTPSLRRFLGIKAFLKRKGL